MKPMPGIICAAIRARSASAPAELPGQNGKHGGAKTDEHVGAQACGLMPELALQTNDAAQERSYHQPRQRRTERSAQFIP